MRLILCTGNPGKVSELRATLPKGMDLLSLADAGLPPDLPETGDSFSANAFQKARHAFVRTGLPCIADDSGLEVAALHGAPGVFSARYAGEPKNDRANIQKLLDALEGTGDRRACFRTMIAVIDPEGEYLFEGVIRGTITTECRGTKGFGYDPVFLPEGCDLTFAEMDARMKNAISHRGQAVRKLARFLAERQR